MLATHQAAAALDGVEAIEHLDEHYITSRPEFTSNTVKYDTRTMTLFEDGSVSLSPVEGWTRCDMNLPDKADGYQHEYLNDDEWEVTESTLSKRDGEYYLHLGFRKDTPEKQVETQGDDEDRTVLGVDLGIVNIATTSTAYFASAENSDISIESSSGFAVISSRRAHNLPIGRFSRRVGVNHGISVTNSIKSLIRISKKH
jgi:hypothetical protein